MNVPRQANSELESAETSAAPIESDAALPTAEVVIARFVQATGGRAAYKATRSMSAQGSLAIPNAGIQGTLEFTYAEGGKWLMKSDLGAAGSEKSGATVKWHGLKLAPTRHES